MMSESGLETAVIETAEEGGAKRKGSPLSKADVKKMSADTGTPTVVGSERKTLRRQNSVPDMLKLGPAKERKANHSLL